MVHINEKRAGDKRHTITWATIRTRSRGATTVFYIARRYSKEILQGVYNETVLRALWDTRLII